MSLDRLAWGTLVGVAALGTALACGPFFPDQLFDDRRATLAEPVGFSFQALAARLLVVRHPGLKAVERDYWNNNDPQVLQSERHEALLDRNSNEFMTKLRQARGASDGEAALRAGQGLPEAALLYIAGAVEFHAGRYDEAMARFKAIEQMPAPQRRLRIVAASYMQGRIHQIKGDVAAARAAFQVTRQEARDAPDPMGLGVASLGEEARIVLARAGLLETRWPVAIESDPKAAADLVVDGVRLYAEQAAYDSKIAANSLREVAALLAADQVLLARAVADPLIRRLIVAYVGSDEGMRGSAGTVVDAVLALPDRPAGDDLDRLAALAYAAGNYDGARRLVETSERPLGLWLRAKLALQQDDRQEAVRHWTAAIVAVERGQSFDKEAVNCLRGEAAVMQFVQGDYRHSLKTLFPAAKDYWGDVTYVAERVLTVDELKSVVDEIWAEPIVEPNWTERDAASARRVNLRNLLARRLMRDGRLNEAVAYIPTRREPIYGEVRLPGTTKAEANAYIHAVEQSRPTWPWLGVSRAQALFAAAMLTRGRGMELMGTEGPPDMSAYGGGYPTGISQANPPKEDDLTGPDEAKRFADSASKPYRRFHYRHIALERALAAADLLPQRSQAYAATLCWASRFAFDVDDQAQAETIYRRYVKTGTYQAWATRFGRVCPQPDFDGARDYWMKRVAAWPRELMRAALRHPALAVGAGLAAMLVLAAAVWAVRRARGRSLRAG